MAQRIDLEQLRKAIASDDQLTPTQIEAVDTLAQHFADHLDAQLSQVKRIIFGDSAGNWNDDFVAQLGDVSLKGLGDALGTGLGWQTLDLLDNATDALVVGAIADVHIKVDYALHLPIAKRTRYGVWQFVVDGATVSLGDDYWCEAPEIGGLTFAASVVGSDVRLDVITNGVGEHPTLYYRITRTP